MRVESNLKMVNENDFSFIKNEPSHNSYFCPSLPPQYFQQKTYICSSFSKFYKKAIEKRLIRGVIPK